MWCVRVDDPFAWGFAPSSHLQHPSSSQQSAAISSSHDQHFAPFCCREILKSWRADNHALGTAGAIDSPMQRHKAQPVSFRDATIHMEDEEEEPAGMEEA